MRSSRARLRTKVGLLHLRYQLRQCQLRQQWLLRLVRRGLPALLEAQAQVLLGALEGEARLQAGSWEEAVGPRQQHHLALQHLWLHDLVGRRRQKAPVMLARAC